MNLFDLLHIWEPAFEAKKAKAHLARYNGNERPLDGFLEGQFDEWQRWLMSVPLPRAYCLADENGVFKTLTTFNRSLPHTSSILSCQT